ncbi:flotillin domain-containing protein [Microsporum canis CBS 113480]|uniref:Flotillin domain-containing protein n=1 Tax=Arthroderma otae (strain ATCC MYA-4605 / CBS 113480) TaxID=554155 RepID=C5FQ84_ARTOC|nr:flotillin domain-containing protein [Microsporum canis CBS 113480]EEQ32037.1 flotillin domain-containing protein [Microsporum canis CBS 113480]
MEHGKAASLVSCAKFPLVLLDVGWFRRFAYAKNVPWQRLLVVPLDRLMKEGKYREFGSKRLAGIIALPGCDGMDMTVSTGLEPYGCLYKPLPFFTSSSHLHTRSYSLHTHSYSPILSTYSPILTHTHPYSLQPQQLYNVSEPNEYLVITGAGIQDVIIKKTAFLMPWQKCTRISISPFDFSLNLQAMTIEKLQFALPAVFTIGPDNNLASLKKYALLLSGKADRKSNSNQASGNYVQDIVKGIIEGETRVIVSGMTMEEIFKERQLFKQHVIDNVQKELDQFGLRIYNANVKELQDAPGSEYFTYLSRKAHEGALNQSKVEVAEARMRGEIGEAEKRGKTKQEISRIDAETAVLETKRRSDKLQADAQLTNRQTELNMGIELARIQAKRHAEAKDSELQKHVETKRAETELERLRAIDVTKSRAAREAAEQTAEATYFSRTKDADANLYRTKVDADAAFYRQTKEAEAAFYAKQKEAEGIMEMAKGYGALADVLGGPQGLLQYMMIQNGTYEKLAKANGQAIHGLQPKISVWNTGSAEGGAGAADPTAPLRNLMQCMPPLFSTIHEQTGIAPPNWVAQMPPPEKQQLLPEHPQKVGGAKVNGSGK